MRKLLFLFLALASVSWGRGLVSGYCERGGENVVTGGQQSSTYVQRNFPSCTVTVYSYGTVTPVAIYSDNSGTVKANPFVSDPRGYWFFFADDANLDVRFSGPGILVPFTRSFTLATGTSSFVVSQTPAPLTIPQSTAGGFIASAWMVNAAADGATKGVSTYTASDFNAASGVISLDYTNGQKATSLIPGFLSAADFATFSAGSAVITATLPLIRTVDDLTCRTATAALSGCLAAVDFTAFNAKAPPDATYITQTANGSLTNEQVLALLSTGLVRVTTTTGVLSSIADSSTIGQVLRVATGPTIAWGAVDLADSDAVTGVLPAANIDAAIARIANINVQGTANEITSTGSGQSPTLSIADTFRITGKTVTAPVKTGTSIPATCTIGDLFFKTDATAGANMYGCTATNTFTVQSGGASGQQHAITFVIDGGGSAITTMALESFPPVAFACTINRIDVTADQSGSITVDIWKAAGAIPSAVDKISASAPATLSSAQINLNGSLSGWTTAVSSGDVFGGTIATAATVERVTIIIWCQ